MQQIVLLLLNGVDTEASPSLALHRRSVFVGIKFGPVSGLDMAADLPSPRMMKSHLPVRYFHKCIDKQSAKIIVVMRNVKDCLVSYYHFMRMNKRLADFDGTFDEFFEMFKNKTLPFGDYFDHVVGWWEQRDKPNILVVLYEDMKRDLTKEIQRVAKFLSRHLDENELATIVKESGFEAMQKNPKTNHENVPAFDMKVSKFMRKGEVGDWKNYFDDSKNILIERLCAERLEPAGIDIPFQMCDTSLNYIR